MHAVDLLLALYQTAPPGTWCELRLLRSGAAPKRYFAKLPATRDALVSMHEWAMSFNAEGWHAYFGVNPRLRESGAEGDIAGFSALVLDIDSRPDGNAGITKLAQAGLPPSAIVRSGRGGHLYLLLDKLEPIDVAKPIARGLHAWIGGDSVWDPPRILRLPGTMNHKPGVNAPCELIYLEPERRYSLAAIVEAMDRAGAPHLGTKPAVVVGGEPRIPRSEQTNNVTPITPEDVDRFDPRERERLLGIRDRLPAHIRELMERGVHPGDGYVSRSEAELPVVRALFAAGATEVDVVTFFRMCRSGIGARLFEKGSTSSLESTIAKARGTSPPSPSDASVAHVRVVQAAWDNRRNRLLLDLLVLDGEHAGAMIANHGISTGNERRERLIGFMLRSLGLSAPPTSLEQYLGREALVQLQLTRSGKLNVTRWLAPTH